MNKLFPIPTEYEILNYTDIPYTSFNLIQTLEEEKKKLNEVKKRGEKKHKIYSYGKP